MKRRLKFFTSVGMLSLTVGMLIMGVYALVQRQISISGTVSFSASTIRADYQVLKTDAYTGEELPAFTEVASGSFNVDMQDNASAALGDMMLSDNANKFAYRVVLTSTEPVRDLVVTYTVPAPAQNWLSVYVNDQLTPETTVTLPQGETLTFDFVVIADPNAAPETAEAIDIGTNFAISLTEADDITETQLRMERIAQRRQALQNNNVKPNPTVAGQTTNNSQTNQTTNNNQTTNQPSRFMPNSQPRTNQTTNTHQAPSVRQITGNNGSQNRVILPSGPEGQNVNTNNHTNNNASNHTNTVAQSQGDKLSNNNQTDQVNQQANKVNNAHNQNTTGQNTTGQNTQQKNPDSETAGTTSNLLRQIGRTAKPEA